MQKTVFYTVSLLLLAGTAVLEGCGSSQPIPMPGGTTNVVVLMTSTANDKLMQFQMGITKITLTDSAGKAVTLFDKPFVQNGATGLTEFMRLNGASEPLVMAPVPQGTYTAASVKVAYCQFGFLTPAPGTFSVNTDAEGLCGQGTGNTTVNLPAPITISGTAMALAFNLQIPQSYTVAAGNSSYTISPVFTLTPVVLAANPSNDHNGKINGLNTRITSVNVAGNSFVAQTADGISSTLSVGTGTQYQGVSVIANLPVGALVDLDGAIQSDGSLLATRLEMQNATVVTSDFLLPLSPASPAGTAVAEPLECFLEAGAFPSCHSVFQMDSTSTLHVSAQMSNLANLPFTPVFDSTSFVLGQNVSVASTTSQFSPLFATDIMLEPQTLNGTVTAVASSGALTVYTVVIAPYHVIPVTQQLAVVAPFAVITNPTTIMVYADGNTQLLQSGAVGVGSLLRFRGLLFDDSGTLRMDCAEILDGVAE